jgi:hypothetical protein
MRYEPTADANLGEVARVSRRPMRASSVDSSDKTFAPK